MKIALVNPPSPFLEEMNIQPPLGLLYIAAMFEKYGQEVSVFDYGVKDYGVLSGYDMYGFGASSPQYPYAVDIASKINGYKIVGGAHVTSIDVEDNCWNAIIKGEAESTVPFLLNKPNTTVMSGEPPKDLDTIPFPARHLVDLNQYIRKVGGKRAAPLICSRGCPFSCSYCDKESCGSYRRRSVKNVIAEIDELINEYGYHVFLFVDDSFTIDKKWIIDLCREIEKRKVIWRCWTRVDLVDLDMLMIMNNAGCIEIAYGIESGSDDMLKSMNKGTTTKQGYEAISMAKKSGIKVRAFLMAGFPTETPKTVAETIKFVEKANPDFWNLGTFTPVVGSDAYKHPEKYGIKSINKDFRQMYSVGHDGKGGVSFVPANGSVDRLIALRDVLLEYLRGRNESQKSDMVRNDYET